MTFSLTFPRRSRLLHSGSYIPYPSRRTNSLPTWNYWWFFKSVKQASRPQSAQGFPLFPPSSVLLPPLHGSRADFTSPSTSPYHRRSIFLPPPAASRGRAPLLRPLLSTLLFIFQTFHFSPPCASFIFPLILERRGGEGSSCAMHKRRERNLRKNNFFDSISFSIEGKSNDLFFSSILTDLRSQILFYPYSINERDRFFDRISSKCNKWTSREESRRTRQFAGKSGKAIGAVFIRDVIWDTGEPLDHPLEPFICIDRQRTTADYNFSQVPPVTRTWMEHMGPIRGRERGRRREGEREREEKSGRISRYPFVSVGWAYNGRSYEKSDLSLASPRGYLYWET